MSGPTGRTGWEQGFALWLERQERDSGPSRTGKRESGPDLPASETKVWRTGAGVGVLPYSTRPGGGCINV